MRIRALLFLMLSALATSLALEAFAQQLLYIHADHLNTPRMVTNGSGTPVWRLDQTEPFGDNLPNEDPDGNSILGHLPLRFPGQYFDKETNLSYNYFRDYDPSIGRYVQSDPIGLDGGINTYLYVGGNPLQLRDPRGLAVLCATNTPDRGSCEAKLALDLAACAILEKGCDAACSVLCRRLPLRKQCTVTCMEDICDPVYAYCYRGAYTDYAMCKKSESNKS